MNFRAVSEQTKTHYDSLLTEGITCKTIPRNQARNFCGGGQFCARIVLMIVSQYGFSEILTHDGVSLDPSRIAAQVVSGIGFIGAGTIIFNHQIVRGLTTAASLWATAGIGLTAGAGMSWLALAATILTLVALEGLSLVFRSLGSRRMVVVFSASDRTGVADTLDRIRTDGYMVVSYEVVPQVVGGDGITYRVTMVVKAKPGSDNNQLLALLRENTDIIVERIA